MGQHFLYDLSLLRSLVESTGIHKTDAALEIGTGSGMLTACLSDAANRVITVDADESIIRYAKASLSAKPNVTYVTGDIRRLNLEKLCEPLGESFYVIANIPYNITTPILNLLWTSALPIQQISVMVQKEVADKLLAIPSTENYGLLSVSCQYYCETRLDRIVPAAAFTPPPKVNSAFIHMIRRKEPPAPVQNELLLFRLLKAGFGLRRKTLSNAIKGALPLTGEEIHRILTTLGLSPTIRGEALSVAEWIGFANACHQAVSRKTSGVSRVSL